MNVAIDLLDDIAQQLAMKWPEVPCGVVEAIAVEGYRSGAPTHGQAECLLTLSWAETEVFPKERQAYGVPAFGLCFHVLEFHGQHVLLGALNRKLGRRQCAG